MKEKIVLTWNIQPSLLNGSRTQFCQTYIKELVQKGQVSITTNLRESMHDDDDDDDDHDHDDDDDDDTKIFVYNAPFSLSSQFDVCIYLWMHAHMYTHMHIHMHTHNSAHLVCF